MTTQLQKPENKVWTWLDKVVIAEDFCPFASVPRQHDRVKLALCSNTATTDILSSIANECRHLDNNDGIETTLLVVTHALKDFYDYLDVLDLAQQLLEELNYDGVYQLASFHPNYLFEGEPENSVSNYTNRAPFPIFHLIREASITKALGFVDDPESIPRRNVEHANKLGLAFFKAFL